MLLVAVETTNTHLQPWLNHPRQPTLLASVCSISTTASAASGHSNTVLRWCRRAVADATATTLLSRWGLDTWLLPSTD